MTVHRFRGQRKQKTVRQLKKKADTLFSQVVRKRGHCELQFFGGKRCGGVLQCSHVFSRARNSTRYNEENSFCACYGHHRYWHQHPIEATRFVENKYGREKLDMLQWKSQQYKSWKVYELEVLIAELEQKLGGG